jgi:hypothetical protein
MSDKRTETNPVSNLAGFVSVYGFAWALQSGMTNWLRRVLQQFAG